MISANYHSTEYIRRQISDELASKRAAFRSGDGTVPADTGLLYYTRPQDFGCMAESARSAMEGSFRSGNEEKRAEILDTVIQLCLGLSSAIMKWNLTNKGLHGDDVLSVDEISKWSNAFSGFLSCLVEEDRAAEGRVLSALRGQLYSRYKAEGLADDDAGNLAQRETSRGLVGYTEGTIASAAKSNVRRLAAEGLSDLGNDYATGLEYPLLLGASLVTTNPPLVLAALKSGALPKAELQRMNACKPDWLSSAASASRLAVLPNAHALRPIFLLTGGKKGYVCLQVDPRYTESDDIVKEAVYQYEELVKELGGIPNVVFKLPATKIGLEACKVLGEMGVGTTATVCFGAFQALEFAEVMNRSQALVSYVVSMNGRLAGPVIDDLQPEYKEAGQLAGVAVAKKFQRAFSGKTGYNSEKVQLMVASLRNYAGSVPDILDTLGASVITIFPDIRRGFDLEECKLTPGSIYEQMDESTLVMLSKSEIFRQAYYTPGDPEMFVPQRPLDLLDDESVQEWEPIRRTLGGFKDAYSQAEAIVDKYIADPV